VRHVLPERQVSASKTERLLNLLIMLLV